MSKEPRTKSLATYMKLLLAIVALFGALIPAVRSSAEAQSKNERDFEDKIPKHLPIKIRIQPDHEKAAKDLNNDRWQHDLAFEVKNTGDRPIYYLSCFLEMPQIKPNGVIVGAHLFYGQRSILGEGKGMAQPEDVPIKPNETIILTLGRQADGWDERSKIEQLPQPTKLEIVFMELNFGDGTGFVGTNGAPWPASKRASLVEKQNPVPASSRRQRLHQVEANNIVGVN